MVLSGFCLFSVSESQFQFVCSYLTSVAVETISMTKMVVVYNGTDHEVVVNNVKSAHIPLQNEIYDRRLRAG